MTKRTRALWFALPLLALLIAPASAAPDFLSPAQTAPQLLLPAPPADGSAVAKAELAELHRIAAQRSPADFARAKADGKVKDASIFAVVLGPQFDLAKLPKTARLFADVRREEKAAVDRAKGYFKRTRPYVVDPTLHGCAEDDAPQTSYPSGHTTMAYSMAVVLAALVPEKAPAILARAAEYAENRLVCGVHYRRDIVAGETYGTVIGVELMEVPSFREEFLAARTELSAAGLVHP